MKNIDNKIELWLKSLLDLSLRNKLINCPAPDKSPSAFRSSLVITKPDPLTLWERFRDGSQSLIFADPEAAEATASASQIASNIIDSKDKIITNKNFYNTNTTLLDLLTKNRIMLNEKGINTLYLAVYFIIWAENNNLKNDDIINNDNNNPSETHRAPLLLVPVTISKKNNKSNYELSRYDDEITLNKTLEQKLYKDYNINLPTYSDELRLEDYISQVKNIISFNKNLIISNEVELSLFYFLKYNIYKDILDNKNLIKEHKIIRAITGDETALSANIPDKLNLNHDVTDPKKTFCVLDADSSQLDAVALAKQGYSFILQGPPGTGKSQTITNIIAELIALNKHVLFVSEKMAALEVVRNRLIEVGLGNYCLTLHDYKSKKKDIYDQLSISLNLPDFKNNYTIDISHKFADLFFIRQQLNNYANDLHTKIEPLGKTFYQVNGLLADLSSYPDINFLPPQAADYTLDDLNTRLRLLEDLAIIVEKGGYPAENPWFDCIITRVTNQFKQRFNINIKNISELKSESSILFNQVSVLTGLNKSLNLSDVQELINLLSVAAASPNAPAAWTGLEETILTKALNWLAELAAHQLSLDTKIHNLNLLKNEYSDQYNKYSSLINQINDITNINIKLNEQSIITKKEISNIIDETIFDIELHELYNRFTTIYKPFWRILKSQYRSDLKIISSKIELNNKLTYDNAIIILKKLVSIKDIYKQYNDNNIIIIQLSNEKYSLEQELNSRNKIIVNLNNDIELTISEIKERKENIKAALWIDIPDNYDYSHLTNLLQWTFNFLKISRDIKISPQYLQNIFNCDKNSLEQSLLLTKELQLWLNRARPIFEEFTNLFNYSNILINKPINYIYNHAINCNEKYDLLQFYIDYNYIQFQSKELNINEYIEIILNNKIQSKDIVNTFKKCFYSAWYDSKILKYNSISNFRSVKHDGLISKFKDLDKFHISTTQKILSNNLLALLPSNNYSSKYNNEYNILKRELNRKRRFNSARKLIAKIPNLLRVLKPCVLMSPLTVSAYLSGGDYKFDTVIFDEASQIPTEEAVGALFRADQAIIVGDNKQLPPTNFFNAISSFEESDEDEVGSLDDGGPYESVIEEAPLLPTITLKWHYRSRHESLIAFSNATFYDNQLITFPSPALDAKDVGVEYVFVETGTYDRGGKKGNRLEAEKVVELICRHFNQRPDRSLGVIAFGDTQQKAIQAALDKKISENRYLADYISDDTDENFFIKSIETVQGDERDTIIFSVGYGPDEDGKFIMNFGPLNKSGGERRLNVAITRARHNIKLVSSIKPEMISDRARAEGVRLLGQYMEFALKGPKALSSQAPDADAIFLESPFEESVYNFLRQQGYEVETQVGCSNFRIDLAVRHPKYANHFVLGVECDGASYHASRNARDRDRLRQAVLEGVGWTIHRVWSTDWVNNQAAAGQSLLAAVNEAIASFREPPPALAPKEDWPKNPSGPSAKVLDNLPMVAQDPLPASELDGLKNPPRPSTGAQDSLSIVAQDPPLKPEAKARPHQERKPQISLDRPDQSLSISKISSEDLKEVMLALVAENEGLAKETLFFKARDHYGWSRLGSNIRKKFSAAFASLTRGGKLKMENDQVFLKHKFND
ncbi:MAG: DUF4011 domain-containing protein [Deltaproteobacteria bacterium]|nr:DUF4011 domain-containing protein [Deltaproteobacteria bacterium]